MPIDWERIASSIGGIDRDGRDRIVGTAGGRRALEVLLGEDNIRDAVDYFISQRPGAFTAEMVLQILKSEVAMERCFEIYKTEPGTARACGAVFVLGCMADAKALPWVREFLEDSDKAVRMNGLAVLQSILCGPLGDDDLATAKELFDFAALDPDPMARTRASDIRAHSALRI